MLIKKEIQPFRFEIDKNRTFENTVVNKIIFKKT